MAGTKPLLEPRWGVSFVVNERSDRLTENWATTSMTLENGHVRTTPKMRDIYVDSRKRTMILMGNATSLMVFVELKMARAICAKVYDRPRAIKLRLFGFTRVFSKVNELFYPM